MEINYLATGIILRARARLRQNPAPPVANQNLTFCCKNEQAIRDRYAAPWETKTTCMYLYNSFDLLFFTLITCSRFGVGAEFNFDWKIKQRVVFRLGI